MIRVQLDCFLVYFYRKTGYTKVINCQICINNLIKKITLNTVLKSVFTGFLE